jgi:hypothetical protein
MSFRLPVGLSRIDLPVGLSRIDADMGCAGASPDRRPRARARLSALRAGQSDPLEQARLQAGKLILRDLHFARQPDSWLVLILVGMTRRTWNSVWRGIAAILTIGVLITVTLMWTAWSTLGAAWLTAGLIRN